ncbi:hypothetical protein [Streptomyces sp. S1D4-14]|uniref:hypothetical protein n=1 Tax=Streptomyces sp. S1D4-14 TaxID=2594461 RepID=UPI001163C4C1|nr:hypothetical protein [Streptomyces sp. S1D4-14]QDN64407.1 hypothetical protein FNV66_00820 [Streptomyces sp. S1D4-14]
MTVKLECERCGNQEQTSGVMLFAGLTGPAIPTARPELPYGWTRPKLPREDGSAWYTDLCPACKADLLRFMAGAVLALDEADACTDCAHHKHVKPCRELTMPGAPGDVDECGCTEGVPEPTCPTCGPAAPLEPHPSLPVQRCSNCKEHLAARNDPKELGIDG